MKKTSARFTAFVSVLLIAAPAMSQESPILSTMTSKTNDAQSYDFTIPPPAKMIEVNIFSAHCAAGANATGTVQAQIFDKSNGGSVGQKISNTASVPGGLKEVTAIAGVKLEPGQYYISLSSTDNNANFKLMAVNISLPGQFTGWGGTIQAGVCP